MQSENKKALLAFYFNSGFREVIPIYPLYAIMFGEHGVSPFELSILFAVWAATGLVLEVPSGALADRFSRKWLIVLSALFKSGAFLSWYLWQEFTGDLTGFILWSVGSSIRSGAWEALLFDLMTRWGERLKFPATYGRIRAAATAGVGAGEVSGGFLIIYGYDWVLLISMLVPLIATVPFTILVSDIRSHPGTGGPNYLTILIGGLRESVYNRAILYILLVSSFLIMIFGVYDEYVTPTLREKGFSLQWVAFLGALVYVSQSIGMMAAAYFNKTTLSRILLTITGAGFALATAAILEGTLLVIVMCLCFSTFGLCSALFGASLQRIIQSESRATVTSITAFGESLGGILGFLAFGLVAQYHGMSGATLATGGAMMLLALLFLKLGKLWKIQLGDQ
jgi:MFS family permease